MEPAVESESVAVASDSTMRLDGPLSGIIVHPAKASSATPIAALRLQSCPICAPQARLSNYQIALVDFSRLRKRKRQNIGSRNAL